MTVRMDNQQKAQFDKLCEQFGMSANTAINIFVKAVIRNHLYFHTPSEPPLCKGDSRDVKNKK